MFFGEDRKLGELWGLTIERPGPSTGKCDVTGRKTTCFQFERKEVNSVSIVLGYGQCQSTMIGSNRFESLFQLGPLSQSGLTLLEVHNPYAIKQARGNLSVKHFGRST